MLVKDAKQITGGLSKPSKMPGTSYSIPASACKVGSKLRTVKGSTCSSCYALKGNYTSYPRVKAAMVKRLESLSHPQWVEAMSLLVAKQSKGHHRWHDSGDLQSVAHLEEIAQVALNTPEVKHWIPTREYHMVKEYLDKHVAFPSNLTVRLSAHMVDGGRFRSHGCPISTVHTEKTEGFVCPAPSQGGSCSDCRVCWDRKVDHVSYRKH